MKKRLMALVAFCFLLAALSGCGAKSDNIGPPAVVDGSVSGGTGGAVQPVSQPADAGGLQFSLSQNSDPGFMDGVDLSNVPDYSDQLEDSNPAGEPMFIERDGYAYQLDPVTLEPMEPPLDLVTHLPVELKEEQEESSPSIEPPTEETEYPNTGIFLEDD